MIYCFWHTNPHILKFIAHYLRRVHYPFQSMFWCILASGSVVVDDRLALGLYYDAIPDINATGVI